MKTACYPAPIAITRQDIHQVLRQIPWHITICLLSLCIIGCTGAPSPTALLRGYQVIIIRLPAESAHVQEDIVIAHDDQGRYYAYRGPSNRRAQGVTPASATRVMLAKPQWEELNTLRKRWCNIRPQSQPVRAERQTYHVAVQCESGAPYQTTFAVDQLPIELRHVLETLPKKNGASQAARIG